MKTSVSQENGYAYMIFTTYLVTRLYGYHSVGHGYTVSNKR